MTTNKGVQNSLSISMAHRSAPVGLSKKNRCITSMPPINQLVACIDSTWMRAKGGLTRTRRTSAPLQNPTKLGADSGASGSVSPWTDVASADAAPLVYSFHSLGFIPMLFTTPCFYIDDEKLTGRTRRAGVGIDSWLPSTVWR